MSPKGFIRSEDLKEARLEAFPYFPVDRNLGQGADTDEDETSIAQIIGGADQPPKTTEQRMVDRLQEAERQAQEIARKAYEEGFASGEAEGRTFGESQYQAYIQRLEGHFRDLAAASLTLREALNEELIALALAVGEYLALQQMDQSPEAVKALMERVLDELPFPLPRGHREGEQPLQAFLNPADLEQLGDHYIGHGGLALAPDAALSRGSIRLEAPQGILDASLERRRAHLMGLMARLKEEAQP
jgi:flagellar biosynthesis/type III secretory pathway protein FliH